MIEHPIVPIRTYLVIYIALLVLLAATLGVAYIDLGGWINTILAMTIAFSKAILVVLYFMHVRHAESVVRLTVGAALLWFVILVVLTLTDYLSRTGLFFLN